jgi:Family of unknown function (DUF6263)
MNMKRRILLSLCCGLSVLALSSCSKKDQAPAASGDPAGSAATGSADVPAPPSGPVELKIKWPVGQRYVQRMELKQKSETMLPQRPEPMKQDTSFAQEYAISVVKDRQPAGKELDLKYLSMQIDVTMNGKSVMSYDSSGESLTVDNDPVLRSMSKLVGMQLTMLLDESNNVEKVEGMDKLKSALLERASPQAKAVMNGMISEDTYKQMAELGKGLPPGPVQPGDTWPVQKEISMGSMGKMVLDLHYSFKGWEPRANRQCALLEFSGNMTSNGIAPAAGPGGVEMKVEDGKISGQTWFDPDLGMLLETKMNQLLNMTITVNASKTAVQGANRQHVSTKLDQTIDIKLVEAGGKPL